MNERTTIHISQQEWDNIVGWMHKSLEFDEQSASGHFLLECNGTDRTWVASNHAQTVIVRGDGPAPIGATDSNGRTQALINSRLFQLRRPWHATVHITTHEHGRQQHFEVDGLRVDLPEHPGGFPDWRDQLERTVGAADGIRVDVDTKLLHAGCVAAGAIPFGISDRPEVLTWISVSDGQLLLETPWADYPNSKITLDLHKPGADTEPVLVEIWRLARLLEPVELDQVRVLLPPTPNRELAIQAGEYTAVLRPIDRWHEQRDRLEQLLCEYLRQDSVATDADGDYPVVTPEGKSLWVRLNTETTPLCVQVFSVLADSISPTPLLLEELNSINASTPFVKVVWASQAIMAEVDLVADTLDLAELGTALESVRLAADRYHDMLSAFFQADAAEDFG